MSELERLKNFTAACVAAGGDQVREIERLREVLALIALHADLMQKPFLPFALRRYAAEVKRVATEALVP